MQSTHGKTPKRKKQVLVLQQNTKGIFWRRDTFFVRLHNSFNERTYSALRKFVEETHFPRTFAGTGCVIMPDY